MNLANPTSTIPRNTDATKTVINTIYVPFMASFLEGHVILLPSRYTSLKYAFTISIFPLISMASPYITGQEGFEPPTPGFGVRCSTVRATGLHASRSARGRAACPAGRPPALTSFPCGACASGRRGSTSASRASRSASSCSASSSSSAACTRRTGA